MRPRATAQESREKALLPGGGGEAGETLAWWAGRPCPLQTRSAGSQGSGGGGTASTAGVGPRQGPQGVPSDAITGAWLWKGWDDLDAPRIRWGS